MTNVKMKLQEMLKEKDTFKKKIERHQEKIDNIDIMIDSIVAKPLSAMRSLQGKKVGTVSIEIENIMVKETLSTTVKWDQNMLKGLAEKIKINGDDPGKFIEAKYSIPKRKFDDYPTKIKKFFSVAMEIKTGKSVLTFKEKEE